MLNFEYVPMYVGKIKEREKVIMSKIERKTKKSVNKKESISKREG